MSRAFWYLAHKRECKERLTARQYESLKKTIGVKGRIPWNKGKKGLQAAWNKGLFGATYPNRKRAIRKPLSEETKKKIGEGNKGKISWSKGKKKSEETLKKMKESQANRRTKEKMNVSND
jgi:hypothetical protein